MYKHKFSIRNFDLIKFIMLRTLACEGFFWLSTQPARIRQAGVNYALICIIRDK